MLDEIDGDQLGEWLEYYDLEPWGPVREDVRALYVAAMAVAPYGKKGSKGPRLKDFFAHLTREEEQTPEQIQAALLAWNAVLGGSMEGGGPGSTPGP